MKKILILLLIFGTTIFADLSQKEVDEAERFILEAYMKAGFYEQHGLEMDWMVQVWVDKKEPVNIEISFNYNMPERRNNEAVILGIRTIGELTKKTRWKSSRLIFSRWDYDHKRFAQSSWILTSDCRRFLEIEKIRSKEDVLNFLKMVLHEIK